jgi:hypothetical protein
MTSIHMFFKEVTESMLNFYVFSKAILDCWIGIIGSAVLSDKLSTLENLLHIVHLFYTSNLKVCFASEFERHRLPKYCQC